MITGLGTDLYFINESRRAEQNSASDVYIYISPSLAETKNCSTQFETLHRQMELCH